MGRGLRTAPPGSCPYSPECVEGIFSELRLDGVLRSSPGALVGGIMVINKKGYLFTLRLGERGTMMPSSDERR